MKLVISAAPVTPATADAIALLLRTAAANVSTFPAVNPPLVMAIRATNGALLGTLTIAEEETR